jgi:myo-inositol-1(or 4)-monophosphatase
MNSPSARQLAAFAIETAEAAGKKLLSEFRKHDPNMRATDKEAKSIGDLMADAIVKKAIRKRFPEHSLLTEETGWVRKGESDYVWIVDPLDGTGNFENHNPFFAVSIALWHKGKPLVGVMEAPALGERYVAVAGQGAYRQDLWRKKKFPAKVSKVSETASSYWVFCQGGEKRRERTVSIFDQAYPQTKEFRKIGSAAIELAWVGTGRSDGYATTSISLWDIAAGMVFVKEAGGKLLRFDGTAYKFPDFFKADTFDFLATNGKVKLTLEA